MKRKFKSTCSFVWNLVISLVFVCAAGECAVGYPIQIDSFFTYTPTRHLSFPPSLSLFLRKGEIKPTAGNCVCVWGGGSGNFSFLNFELNLLTFVHVRESVNGMLHEVEICAHLCVCVCVHSSLLNSAFGPTLAVWV